MPIEIQELPRRLPADNEALRKEREIASREYRNAIESIRDVFWSIRRPQTTGYRRLLRVAARLLALIQTGNQSLLALTARSTAGNYLYGHSVNVCILSLRLGAGLGLPEDEMLLLGIAALLHDLGMLDHLHLALEGRMLDARERASLRRHPRGGRRFLQHIQDIQEGARRTLTETMSHRGKANAPLHARVIGLCDAYEAMSHPRNWRRAITAHQALTTIAREHAEEFGAGLVRELLLQLSLYPPGSFVELSTGDIACVTAANRGLPTRPVVELLATPDGKRHAPPKLRNLAETPGWSVRRSVDASSLPLQDARLEALLECNRWWV